MDITKKVIVIIELITLFLLWTCAIVLNNSTSILLVNILSSIAMSICSFGTGFLLYNIIKEWKEIESNKS